MTHVLLRMSNNKSSVVQFKKEQEIKIALEPAFLGR